MKPLALFVVALCGAFLLTGCVTDSRGRQRFDAATAASWIELGSRAVNWIDRAAVPQASRTIIRKADGEWRWQEDGWTWCPDMRPAFHKTAMEMRLPEELPESWRRTLYDGEKVIEPVVVLNGVPLVEDE